jgi:hypothetical protein
MLATADENGIVGASVGGLAHISRVDRDECEAALETFLNPDPDSRTEENEGRRIERVDGGWRILNHRKYRDMRTQKQIDDAERQKKHRNKKDWRDQSSDEWAEWLDRDDCDVSQVSRGVATEEEAEAEAYPPSPSSSPWTVPDQFQPDLHELITRVEQAGGSSKAWLAEIGVAKDGMHGPARSPEQIGQTIRDFNAAGADLSLRLFRGYLRGNGSSGADRGRNGLPAPKKNGLVAAADLLGRVLAQAPQGRMSLNPKWREKFSETELRVINAIGLDRILANDEKTRGILQAQTSKMLSELSNG